jgi:hypothetical protein
MRVAICQPNYLPWRGYFDLIRQVDLFVSLDDVQYTKGDWRNRNKIRTDSGVKWITVPVKYSFSGRQNINEVLIDYSRDWRNQHLTLLRMAYGNAPFYDCFYGELCEIITDEFPTICDLNYRLTSWILGKLSIETPIVSSVMIPSKGKKEERVLEILKSVDASVYLSGPSAKNYLSPTRFLSEGIEVEFINYDYPKYLQVFPGFEGGVSIVDLLFNQGPSSKDLICSKGRNEIFK